VVNGATVEDIHGIDNERDIRRIFAWGRLSVMPLLETVVRDRDGCAVVAINQECYPWT